jgi:glycosyltransferase involved in cell wall biosynthesis
MRILIVMDPGILVPPKGYGGHERLVEMFAMEYSRLGHEVHLLVTEGSVVKDCIVHPFGKEGFPPKKWNARIAIPKAWFFLWKHRNEFDLIHNFGRLAYLIPILNLSVKKIMTYGREISQKNITIINRLPNQNIVFTGCSQNLISRINATGKWKAVYNAIRFEQYTLNSQVDTKAPLMFLGRIERIKGCHTAIQVALSTNHKLIIAGNISRLPEEIRYFEEEIQPLIDNEQIIYVGEVNDSQKNEYLGSSKALLMPIEWNEPFGIVMIEAMACGTPVIAFQSGSVDEVVENGITGFIVGNQQQMIDVVLNKLPLDRSKCRERAEGRFDVKKISQDYLSLF